MAASSFAIWRIMSSFDNFAVFAAAGAAAEEPESAGRLVVADAAAGLGTVAVAGEATVVLATAGGGGFDVAEEVGLLDDFLLVFDGILGFVAAATPRLVSFLVPRSLLRAVGDRERDRLDE